MHHFKSAELVRYISDENHQWQGMKMVWHLSPSQHPPLGGVHQASRTSSWNLINGATYFSGEDEHPMQQWWGRTPWSRAGPNFSGEEEPDGAEQALTLPSSGFSGEDEQPQHCLFHSSVVTVSSRAGHNAAFLSGEDQQRAVEQALRNYPKSCTTSPSLSTVDLYVN